MRLVRVMFAYEVPSPSAPSVSRVNWCSSFAGVHLQIARDGDCVRIADSETGRTFLYPWSAVAAAEPMPPEAQVQPVVTHQKRAKL